MTLPWLRKQDPRYFQIGALSLLLIFLLATRDFSLGLVSILTLIFTCLATQGVGIWFLNQPLSSLLSCLISAISLCLLCRSHSLWVLALTSFLSIASKFTLKLNGKHFFNPTNFGILVTLTLTQKLWVSPGQWGDAVMLMAWISLMGMAVVYSAARFDITFTFLVSFCFLLMARVIYLGQPWAVLFHQINNGSLLLFSFFMISDPRSTPNHKLGRILFALLVAFLTFYFRFVLFHPLAIFWALFIISPFTLVIDALFSSERFEWPNVNYVRGLKVPLTKQRQST
jgi:Na+-transporting NADH:ubiquinone oxidoreductase subunit NqrB